MASNNEIRTPIESPIMPSISPLEFFPPQCDWDGNMIMPSISPLEFSPPKSDWNETMDDDYYYYEEEGDDDDDGGGGVVSSLLDQFDQLFMKTKPSNNSCTTHVHEHERDTPKSDDYTVSLDGLNPTLHQDQDLHPPRSASYFECNMCMKMAREPVVTTCGHLYCRPCLYTYSSQKEECLVCKSKVFNSLITPIYNCRDLNSGFSVPPRPSSRAQQAISRIKQWQNKDFAVEEGHQMVGELIYHWQVLAEEHLVPRSVYHSGLVSAQEFKQAADKWETMHTSIEHLQKSRSQCAAHHLELQGLRNQAQEVEAQIAKLQTDLKTIRNKEKEVHLQLQTNLKKSWELQKQITTTAQPGLEKSHVIILKGSTLRADMDAKFKFLKVILTSLVL
ncbi:hypothetical protein PRUPE_2G123600 [Prunus persica]|uniref:E3 ubiquitin-protein ligase RMA n=1 Tax=Prunus persica TaxID=3760 RepID=A0A251QF12_PRUPE|nr:hypothetical protein PRUPE_2G123600 [Prunus persica]